MIESRHNILTSRILYAADMTATSGSVTRVYPKGETIQLTHSTGKVYSVKNLRSNGCSVNGKFIRPGLAFDDGNVRILSNPDMHLRVGVPGPDDTVSWVSPMQVKNGFGALR